MVGIFYACSVLEHNSSAHIYFYYLFLLDCKHFRVRRDCNSVTMLLFVLNEIGIFVLLAQFWNIISLHISTVSLSFC